ncbi:MAG: isocitrate lyase/phosphoenolpyruvate mutase family protein [Gemmatimonadetes bacterium]|nr:isocitrate lyase/phosphoenolpyruvate mutase family protein [Gemmatimonadota bacterium]
MNQAQKAETLRRLHGGPRALVLPNVWDVVGARIVEQAGFPAIATSSAAVAWALGYSDGERIGRDEMAAAAARIARAVAVPVTADMEAGYGPRPEDAAATARAVVAAGAVGMNLEDAADGEGIALLDVALQAERIRAAREAAAVAGVPIVINARTDVYLAGIGEPASRLGHAVRRLNAYREAGADCLFCPGVKDAGVIAALVRELTGPLNILAGPGAPSVPELERLGVRRVSLGAGVMRTALGAVRRVAVELGGPGTYTAIADLALTDDLNHLLS